MNRRMIWRAPLAASALAGLLGCQGYLYLRDATPEIERARQDYVHNNPGNDFNDDITLGRVRVGMSHLQVRVAWGDPDRVDLSTRPGSGEVWSYDGSDESSGTAVYMLHFDREILTSMHIERSGLLLPGSVHEPKDKQEVPRGDVPADPGKKPL